MKSKLKDTRGKNGRPAMRVVEARPAVVICDITPYDMRREDGRMVTIEALSFPISDSDPRGN